jgi:hypothetical protein
MAGAPDEAALKSLEEKGRELARAVLASSKPTVHVSPEKFKK